MTSIDTALALLALALPWLFLFLCIYGVADLAMDMRELDAKQKAKNGNDNL